MKKQLKNWEKIFIYISIVFIIGCIIFYGYRLIHFYKIEHPEIDVSDKTLITAINRNNNIVVINDGLYKINDNEFYFRGIELNNYVYYSGRLWQIISFNKDSVKLISKDSQTSLVWGLNNDYEKSYINNWLNGENNIFYNSLSDKENIVKSSFCIDHVSLSKLTCQEKIENYVGLLTIKEYIESGSEKSFLNNNTYWWTSNTTDDDKIWYIFPEGGVGNQSNNEMTYHSYGVRPVINIKSNITVYKGDGSIDNPFVLDKNDNPALNTKSIGSYLNYSNHTWRIIDKNDKYIKVVMDGYLKVNDDNYQLSYNSSSSMYSTNSNISKYLNNTFYKTLNAKSLKACSFNIGSYGSDSSYNYQNVYKNKIETKVGIQSIGELFINDYNNTWLTNNINNIKLTAYITNENNTLFADSITNKNYIRPVICLDNNIAVESGDGTLNNPFTWEDQNETNN